MDRGTETPPDNMDHFVGGSYFIGNVKSEIIERNLYLPKTWGKMSEVHKNLRHISSRGRRELTSIGHLLRIRHFLYPITFDVQVPCFPYEER